jgi:magnesium chelatase family protein
MKDMPLESIQGIELRFVETLEEVIKSFSGQLSVFTIAPSTSK